MPKNKGEMKYLQPWKGFFRVRIRVPAELRPVIGKRELTEFLGIPVNKPCVAERMKHDVVARFLGNARHRTGEPQRRTGRTR